MAWYDAANKRQVVVGVIILGSEEPNNDQRCGAFGRHSVITQISEYSNWIDATIKGQMVTDCMVNKDLGPPCDPNSNETDCKGRSGDGGHTVSGSPPSGALQPHLCLVGLLSLIIAVASLGVQ